MSAARGLLLGTLALSAMEAVVSSSSAVSNASGIFGLLTSALNRIIDPSLPLIPDHRTKGE